MVLAVGVKVSFVDAKNKTSSTRLALPNSLSLVQIGEFLTAGAQIITNMTTCRITSISATFSVDISGLGLKATANVLADAAKKAFFGFNTAVSGFFTKMKVPTIDESKVAAGSDAIDTEDSDVAAFRTMFINGVAVTGGTASPCDSYENDIVSGRYSRELSTKR